MKTIITIGRQYGSGGREIGKLLSEKLGIGYYDKELLRKAAQDSGLCEKVMESFDERPKSLLYSIAMDTYMFSLPGMGATDSLEQQVYLATFESIRRVAEEGSCVIIGRCADYTLADNENLLKIFITAPMEQRMERVSQRKELTRDKAKQLITRTDKRRASYYEYYSSQRWGQVDTYDCCIDSSLLGVEGTVEFIAKLVEMKEK
ncbi:cytidylate kinase-like family protein [Bengtsoniella intestinalis]|uniref:cytidylate kinase-like family protein n=1 Tax=Bengtsoniella intestinalis TaxID=3073143 RepID=UPI00391F989F